MSARDLAWSSGALGPLLGDDSRDLSWQDAALCAQADPDAWFPEKGGSVALAKAICHGCPARAECLEFALENDEKFGIWGGTTERQRRALIAAREREPAAPALCVSGRHLKTGPGRCPACTREYEREREKTRVRDQVAVYAARVARVRAAEGAAA